MDRERDRQTEILKKEGQTERNAGKVRGFCKSMIGLKRQKNRERRENVG